MASWYSDEFLLLFEVKRRPPSRAKRQKKIWIKKTFLFLIPLNFKLILYSKNGDTKKTPELNSGVHTLNKNS
ncbi:hypothetical protein C4F40_12425 [Sphingobacterium sp. Ka21]|uniref:Uncharacterized protein n=1 Tax=Sphingobacterium pedocola TaxID=2082722 RepID=A0ABR9T946_9SPHI|nr:hypothetical protein [Sphingobacterium pedocola]